MYKMICIINSQKIKKLRIVLVLVCCVKCVDPLLELLECNPEHDVVGHDPQTAGSEALVEGREPLLSGCLHGTVYHVPESFHL